MTSTLLATVIAAGTASGTAPGGGARITDPWTSHLAALGVDGNNLELIVLRFLLMTKPRTWSSTEIARHVGLHPWSVSPRMKPLQKKGLVQAHPPEYRLNSSNVMRPMIVWSYA